MIRYLFFLIYNVLFIIAADAQINRCFESRHQDWWDVLHYDLSIDFNLSDSSIAGTSIVMARAVKERQSVVQIDIQEPLIVNRTSYRLKGKEKKDVSFVQSGHTTLITIPYTEVQPGDTFFIFIEYSGRPARAVNAPWDGGIVISASEGNIPWWGVACEGTGASVFFPCKDILADEPDMGVDLHYKAPEGVTAVGNGRLIATTKEGTDICYHYRVTEPINNYNITFYIGNFETVSRTVETQNGSLDIAFLYLKEHESKALELFSTLPGMIAALEYWAGPYPYYKDGFRMVEAPYLGMEHQSAIAYGNGYRMGYKGEDRSGSGAGLLFDFIAIHESAHEWFGNNISIANTCDMWINEGFTTYMESLYLEYTYGIDIARLYRIGKKKLISNRQPVEGNCTTCRSGDSDTYDKAAAMIHHLRMIMNDDDRFRQMLVEMNSTFRGKAIHGAAVQKFIQGFCDRNISGVFKQYLSSSSLPLLRFHKDKGRQVRYKWDQCVEGFDMPVSLLYKGEKKMIYPTDQWQAMESDFASWKADDEWLVEYDFGKR